jgi:hypothetical protein
MKRFDRRVPTSIKTLLGLSRGIMTHFPSL